MNCYNTDNHEDLSVQHIYNRYLIGRIIILLNNSYLIELNTNKYCTSSNLFTNFTPILLNTSICRKSRDLRF